MAASYRALGHRRDPAQVSWLDAAEAGVVGSLLVAQAAAPGRHPDLPARLRRLRAHIGVGGPPTRMHDAGPDLHALRRARRLAGDVTATVGLPARVRQAAAALEDDAVVASPVAAAMLLYQHGAGDLAHPHSLDRPAIVPEIAGAAAALIVEFGARDDALVDVLLGRTHARGRLPFDLPSSTAAVVASRTDTPFDTADPLFRFGDGLVS